MATPYRETLEKIRRFFPQPTSDPEHDAYFVFSILRALEGVDALKSEIPLLGEPGAPDFEGAREDALGGEVSTIEAVTRELVRHLEGLPNWGHPRNQINVVAPPTIPSIIGSLLPSIYNPNLVSEESSMRVLEAEARVVAIASRLIGYDPRVSGGVFTFGGTGTNLYGARIGLEKARPGTREKGLGREGEVVLIASAESHYSNLSVAGWLGIGERNRLLVPTDPDSSMRIDRLEETVREAIRDGRRIAAIVATMGTTDAFGIDDLRAIVELRDRLVEELDLDYRPHVHADAVIGWAWSVFSDYDFAANRMGFRPLTLRALAKACRDIRWLFLADSLGIDFHKTGFAPYCSSLCLVKDRSDLDRIARRRDTMPYLFQSGECHPGMFTLETSRSGSGPLAALANLRLLGKTGLRALLGHLVEMAEVLREHLESHAATTVLNRRNAGTVTLFRVYPDGVDTWGVKERERTDPSAREELRAHNEYNRKVFERLHDRAMRGEGVLISMTDDYRPSDYGEPIAALKSYCLSPFMNEENVEALVAELLAARPGLDEGTGS